MDPLEQLKALRGELDRVAAQHLAQGQEVPPEVRARLDQVKGEMARLEQKLAAAPKPKTAAELKALAEQRAGEKMKRVEEIRELKKKHGAAWVFVPTAAELAAAAVTPIAAAEVPGMIKSMFEQLEIRPGSHRPDAGTADREIWEDLSETDTDRMEPPPLKQRPAPREKPKNAANEGEREDIWDDLSQMDEGGR